VKKGAEFIIPFKGLKIGLHHFEFDVKGPFFAEYSDNEELNQVSGKAFVTLEKLSTIMTVNVSFSGILETICDSCGDDLSLEIENDLKQYVKFGIEEDNDNDEIIVIPFEAYQISVLQPIYECLVLSIPLKRAHNEGECNAESLKKLKALNPVFSKKEEVKVESTDPRWAALNKFKNN